MTGGVLSRRTIWAFDASTFPALPTAKYVSVVAPSPVIVTEPAEPAMTPDPACAPLRLKWISFTPDPPGLSVAASATVTLLLFQPAALGAGDGVGVVVGGVVSAATGVRIGNTPESEVAESGGSMTTSAVNVWSRFATSLGPGSGKPGPMVPGGNPFGASVRAAISAEIWNRTVRGVAPVPTRAA